MKTPFSLRYGVDAPYVIVLFLLSAFVLGFVALCLDDIPTSSTILADLYGLAEILVILMAIGAGALGLSMIVYALMGKHRLRDYMLSQISWQGNEHVLDIGTGRGLLAIGAAKFLRRGKVTAIDIWRKGDLSGNGKDAAIQNAMDEEVTERIEFIEANAVQIPLPDVSVDVVLSVLCLHNIETTEGQAAACREIARVLKRGGTAMIADYTGVSSYGKILADAGLRVKRSRLVPSIALCWMRLLIASKY